MQSLVRGMENVSVTDEGVLSMQVSASRGMAERGRGERGMSRGTGRGWRAGSPQMSGGGGDWTKAGQEKFAEDQKWEAGLSRYNPRQGQRYDGHHFDDDSAFSPHRQGHEQRTWRPSTYSRGFHPSRSDSFAKISEHGRATSSTQGGHPQPGHFPRSDGNDSVGEKREASEIRQKSAERNHSSRTSSHRNSSDSVNPLPTDPASKFFPITQTTAIPAHLQHPFRLLEPGTTFDISAALSAEPVTERHPTAEYMTMARASPTIYSARPFQQDVDPRSTRKLIVLDLNGALLVRSKRSTIPLENIQREVYPRPFLAPFLAYILEAARPVNVPSNPFDLKEQMMRPYEAFVWSSAQPVNVDGMIRKAFGKWGMPTSPRAGDRAMCERMLRSFERVESRPGRVLGVWTRNEMDLTRAQYGKLWVRSFSLKSRITLVEQVRNP